MNPHTQDIIRALARLVDGEQVPPVESEAFDRLKRAVGGFLKHGTDPDRIELGGLALGLLIDRCRASISTEQLLRDLGGPTA